MDFSKQAGNNYGQKISGGNITKKKTVVKIKTGKINPQEMKTAKVTGSTAKVVEEKKTVQKPAPKKEKRSVDVHENDELMKAMRLKKIRKAIEAEKLSRKKSKPVRKKKEVKPELKIDEKEIVANDKATATLSQHNPLSELKPVTEKKDEGSN